MRIEAVRGDITLEPVDAVVNAANSSLLGGGGVDGALHAAAGPGLMDACRALRGGVLPGGLPTGEAVLTPGFDLPATWVIHTVGPKHWEHHDGGVAHLRSCHERSLALADEVDARTVAFPAISCGVYGWDPSDAAPVALDAVRHYARTRDTRIELVRFVLFNDDAYQAFAESCSALE